MTALKTLFTLYLPALFLLVFGSNAGAQETPQLDTLTLRNGLKVYFIQYGSDSTIKIRLVFNGGKRNETSCQTGYSQVIQLLLDENLATGRQSELKFKNPFLCEISRGQTVISANCLNKNLSEELNFLGSTVSRLRFMHYKVDRIVTSITDSLFIEKIPSLRLSELYRDLSLYGSKNPMGRNYCQLQLQKVLPEELKQFYLKNYTPKKSALVLCGNFDVNEAKKNVIRRFGQWKSKSRNTKGNENIELMTPKIKSKEIVFVNKHNEEQYLLKWILAAPSVKAPDHLAFTVLCKVFQQRLNNLITSGEYKYLDSLSIKHVSYASDFIEVDGSTNRTELSTLIKGFDTLLTNFRNLEITEAHLREAVKDLKSAWIGDKTPAGISTFYDPLFYDFDWRRNYLSNLADVNTFQLQTLLKKYFNPSLYKLIVIGKELSEAQQINLTAKITKYNTTDFEICDESCLIVGRKGELKLCWHCIANLRPCQRNRLFIQKYLFMKR